MNRRNFLKISGLVSAAAASATGCAPVKTEHLLSQVDRLAAPAPGVAEWYATACSLCGSGCGAMLRVVDGRAKKMEGLPDHPVNHGGMCALGQSTVQQMYHPDRVTDPLYHLRGSDTRIPLGWDLAISKLAVNPPDAIVVGHTVSGARLELLRRVAKATGGTVFQYQPFGHEALYAVCREVFGSPTVPTFDLAHSDVVVSFGADLFETWLSPNFYKWGFGELRRGREDHRGEFIYVGPRQSSTAAVADKWIYCKPGTTGAVALGVMRALSDLGVVGVPAGAGMDPAAASAASGTPEAQIRWLAGKLASARPALVIGGGDAEAHTNATDTLRAIYALDVALGSVGVKGGILPAHGAPVPGLTGATHSTYSDLETLLGRMHSGAIRSLWLVEGADLMHAGPSSLGVAGAIGAVPFVASFTTQLDDTSALADLVLPDATALERWGTTVPDVGVGDGVATLMQPAVAPWANVRSAEDVILAAAKKAGGPLGAALPYADNEAFVKSLWGGQGTWTDLLMAGGKTGGAPLPLAAHFPAGLTFTPPAFSGDSATYGFSLIPVVTVKYHAGQGAFLPWMQELPDPITTDTWNSWAEMNTQTMDKLGLKPGDYVYVETPVGRQKVVALHNPGLDPDAIAIPAGLGHKNFGRYAAGRGFDVWTLISASREPSGGVAWGGTRAKVTPAGEMGQPALWQTNFDNNENTLPTFLR